MSPGVLLPLKYWLSTTGRGHTHRHTHKHTHTHTHTHRVPFPLHDVSIFVATVISWGMNNEQLMNVLWGFLTVGHCLLKLSILTKSHLMPRPRYMTFRFIRLLLCSQAFCLVNRHLKSKSKSKICQRRFVWSGGLFVAIIKNCGRVENWGCDPVMWARLQTSHDVNDMSSLLNVS